MRFMRHWETTSTPGTRPSWVQIEKNACSNVKLQDLHYINGSIPNIMNPLIKGTLRAYREGQTLCGVNRAGTERELLWYNKHINIDTKRLFWKQWYCRGIKCISQIMENGTVTPFERLRQEFNVPSTAFFGYLQLTHALKAWQAVRQNAADPNATNNWDNSFRCGKRMVSVVYKFLLGARPAPLSGLCAVWATDTSLSLPEGTWSGIWSATVSCQYSANVSQSLFFLMHRAAWTPVKKFRAGLSESDACWRCGEGIGTLVHMIYKYTASSVSPPPCRRQS